MIGCCSIPDCKDESDAKGRQEGGYPARDTLGKNATLTWRVGKKREAGEGVGDEGKVAGVPTHMTVGQDGGRGGTCTIYILGELGHVRPTVNGKALYKEFRKSERGPRGTSWGWWFSVRYIGISGALNSSSTSDLLHAWCMNLPRCGHMTCASRFMPSRCWRRPPNTTWHACLIMLTCALSTLSLWL